MKLYKPVTLKNQINEKSQLKVFRFQKRVNLLGFVFPLDTVSEHGFWLYCINEQWGSTPCLSLC